MIELFVSAFITFFVVIDPPGCAPIFAGLTSGATAAHRRAMAIRAVLVAAILLAIFSLFGEALLGALGIDLASFRIAGGIMLFVIALEMVFEKRQQRKSDNAERIVEAQEIDDISIFPMAMPMIAGPGSIATVMLLFSHNEGLDAAVAIGGALAAVLALTLLALLLAGPLMRLVGEKIEAIVTRLLGVLLAAFSVQFIIDGLRESFRALS